jgi:hypothetical protein
MKRSARRPPRLTQFGLLAYLLSLIACAADDTTAPPDAGEEPWREPNYARLPEDDPNQTCCFVQSMRYQHRDSRPGGRRPCDRDPNAGPRIPSRDTNDFVLRIVDGCPVFVLADDESPDAGPGLDAGEVGDAGGSGSTLYRPGAPIFDVLDRDYPELTCCHQPSTSFCGPIFVGGRRRCSTNGVRSSGGYDTADPYSHELRVVDGCPVYVEVADCCCDPGESIGPP